MLYPAPDDDDDTRSQARPQRYPEVKKTVSCVLERKTEIDSASTLAMDDLPPTPGTISSTASQSSLKPRPLNFSRPRPATTNSNATSHAPSHLQREQRTDSAQALSVKAFHEQATNLPSEPRFSGESQRTIASTTSAASEFAWDGQLGELRSQRRPEEYERNQRYAKAPYSSRSTTSDSYGSSNTSQASSALPLVAELPGSKAAPPAPAPTSKRQSILKRVVSTASSDHASVRSTSTLSEHGWEDSASHHTMSVMGDNNSHPGMEPEGNKWSSSTHDTSGLSRAEIQKLRKKGINPALYAEMKAARKGKGKFIGPLVGNTFIG